MSLSLFVPLDVDYQNDPKVIAAGPLAECLFVRALALCKRTMSDGRVHRAQLPGLALGLPGARAKHARALVEVGLWAETDDGWLVSAWSTWNPSAASIRENQQARTAAGAKANHDRWHVGPTGRPKIGCPHCSESDPNRTPTSDENGLPKEEGRQRKREGKAEEEEEGTSVSSSRSLTLVAPDPDDDDHRFIDQTLDRIAASRTQRANPANPIAYANAVRADLEANERDYVLAAHQLRPDLDPAALANHYEARPQLRTAR